MRHRECLTPLPVRQSRPAQERRNRGMLTPPEPIQIDPRGTSFEADLAKLPRRPGIYLLEFASREPYLGWSLSFGKRLSRLFLVTKDRVGAAARVRDQLTAIRCWPTASQLEKALTQYSLARQIYPRDYRQRLKLRSPWFLSLLLDDPFPRMHISNRLPAGALTIGPFRNRDIAEAFEQECSGLFQLRRCTEDLAPHPEHPGCIYGEMNLCLRPCQLAVTPEEYASETNRASSFLSTAGLSLMSPLKTARDQASEVMDFEVAARLHKQIEKLKGVAALRGEFVQPIDELHGIAVSRAVAERAVQLWPVLAGFLQSPVNLNFDAGEDSRSMDAVLRESVTNVVAAARRDGVRLDDLAILARWYYSSWRDGAWIPFRDVSRLNYRRLVKEISALVKPPAEPASGVPF
jgi:excinuclease ABC subunit C